VKPNYGKMTLANLKEYILKKRDNVDEIETFFLLDVSPTQKPFYFHLLKQIENGKNKRLLGVAIAVATWQEY